MSSIVLPTRALVGLLTDLALTACTDPDYPSLCSILLHTDTGEFLIDLPDDGGDVQEMLIGPMESGLLVGTSTDRVVVAQAHSAAEGDGLDGPVLVSTSDVSALVKVFKPLIHSLGKEVTHRSVLEAAPGQLNVREDPRQVPDGISLTVPLLLAEEFPAAWTVMAPDPTELVPDSDGVVVPATYGTAFGRYMETLGIVGRHRGMPVVIYRHHQNRTVVAEIGASYRAAVRPVTLRDETQLAAPMVRVFVPTGMPVRIP